MQIINKRSAEGYDLSRVEIKGRLAKFHACSIRELSVILCLICLCSTAIAVDYYTGETYKFSTPSYPGYLYLWSAENEPGHSAGSSPDYSKDTFIWTAPPEPQKVIISVIVTSNLLESCKDYAEMPINISSLGSIIVVKHAIPNDPQAFQFTGSPDIGPFTLYDDGISNPDSTSNRQTFDKLLPGAYSIEETVPAGWTLTSAVCSDGSPVDKIDLAPGESVTATFTDTELGRIEITKAVNWNGVTPDPSQTFEICLRGPSYPLGTEEFACKTVGSEGGKLIWTDLMPGNYTVAEKDPGAQWTFTVPDAIDLSAGETKTATVTNHHKLGGLTVNKTVDWNGAAPDDNQTFEICLKGPSYPDGDCKTIGSEGGDLAWSDLIPGEYAVTETLLVGWTTTITGSPATVTSGQTAECAVSNVKYPFGGKFQISGLKFNDLNGNGIKDPNEPGIKGWMIHLKLEGGEYSQSMLTGDDGSYLFTDLPEAGNYVAWEDLSLNPGWIPTTPAGGSTSVVLTSESPTATVNFGNMQPHLVVTKVVDSASAIAGSTVNFTITVTNDGEAAVDNVEPVDTLSPGLIYQSAEPEPSHINGNLITWNLGTLGPHESGQVILKAQVDPTLCPGQGVTTTEASSTSTEDQLRVLSATIEPANLPAIMESLTRNKTKLEVKLDRIRLHRDAFNKTHATLNSTAKTILGLNYTLNRYMNISIGESLTEQLNATGFLVAVEYARLDIGDLLKTVYGSNGEILSDFYDSKSTRESLLIEYNEPSLGYRTYTVRYSATGDTLTIVVNSNGDVISRDYEKTPGLLEITGPLTNCVKVYGIVGVTPIESNEACVQIGWGCLVPQPEALKIDVKKVADPKFISQDDVGKTIKYTYTVKNIGKAEILFLTLVDDKAGFIVEDESVILPSGDSLTYVAYYTVKQSDLKNPSLINVVTATGIGENGLTATATDRAEVTIVATDCVWLNKTASMRVVKPGDYITYTIDYGVKQDCGLGGIEDITIAEKYPNGVFFVSASPSPTYGGNIWADLPNLKAGQSGKITIIVQVAQNTGNTIFNMDQGVTGTGFVNVHNDICTKPPLLTNVVNMNYSEADANNGILVPRGGQRYKSASSDVNLGPPGSCINLREYGSGQYASEDRIKYQNSNRSIEWNKSLKVTHKPSTFSLPGNRSINYSTKWIELDRTKNYATGGSTNEEYTYADKIDRKAHTKLDENGSTVTTDTAFEGVGHLGFLKKDANMNTTWNATKIFESEEDYVGKFHINQKFDEYGSNVEFEKSVTGQGYVAGDRNVGLSQKSYESGTGSYKSDERISTVVNYIAKVVELQHAPASFSYTPTVSTSSDLLWEEGMWSKTPNSLIGERFSSVRSLQENTTAPGLNEMRTEANVTGKAEFRTVYKDPHKNSSNEVDIDDEFIGQYAIKRMTSLSGVAKYNRPHISLSQEAIVDLINTTFADYRIVVENDGDRVLGPVYVKDIFPAGTDYVYSSLRPTEQTQDYANWTMLSLGIGSKVTINLRLNITAEPDNLINRVQATGMHSSGWTQATNFSAIQLHWLTCCPPQLSTSKSARIDSIDTNVVWYRLDLRNKEKYTMVAFLMDQLPPGMVFLNSSLEPSENGTNHITWTILNLGPQEQKSIIYRARAAGDGTYVNQAHIDAYSVDGPDAAAADVTSRVDIGTGGAVYPSHSSDWYPPACFGLNCSGQIVDDDWAPCDNCGASEPTPRSKRSILRQLRTFGR